MHFSPALDLTFHVLAAGTRRSMIQALARGEARSAGELGQFRSAQPTISKHLKVLEQAGICGLARRRRSIDSAIGAGGPAWKRIRNLSPMRALFRGTGAIREVRIFGGIGFMLNGNSVVAASRAADYCSGSGKTVRPTRLRSLAHGR